MMARHVVDAQHFQRHPPDMTVSPDEIIYRSQPGCPLELSELAIHCVQGLPEDRPKLRQIVERLTAIENVDVHVGTTLVVAPSVARAARNMMRKKDAAGKKSPHGQNEGYPTDLQPRHQLQEQGYDNNSSIQGVANTWRMTDEENTYSTSRRTESRLVGSQSTFKVRRQCQDRGSSAAPLVPGTGNQQIPGHDGGNLEMGLLRRDASDTSLESEDGLTFRMPLWDSINSPENQERLRRWQESESVHVSTIDGTGTAMQSWDRDSVPIRKILSTERDAEYGNTSPHRSHIRDGYRGEDDFAGGSDSDDDILSDELDDDGVDSLLYDDDDDDEDVSRMGGAAGTYQLSSDSDGSMSAESLTDSVVMALDMLEIPDLLMASLPQPQHQKPQAEEDTDVSMREFLYKTTLAIEQTTPEILPPDLDRQSSLASRILPPIPASQNPWSFPRYNSNDNSGRRSNRDVHDSILIVEHTEDTAAAPPEPPAKTSSLLVRVNTWRSNRQNKEELQDVTGALMEGEDKEQPSHHQVSVPGSDPASHMAAAAAAAARAQLSPSPSTSSPTSSASSSSRELKSTAATSLATSPHNGTVVGHGGGRGLGLVRGMSDSFWSLRSTSPPPSTTELAAAGVVIGSSPLALSTSPQGLVRAGGGLFERGGAVITDTIAAAATTMTISAKTWNNSTNGFAQWIGHYANMPLDESLEPKSNPVIDPAATSHGSLSPLVSQRIKTSLLKRHLSLKDNKQKSQERQRSSDQGSLSQDESQHPQPLIRRRNTTSTSKKTGSAATSTGFPHRFSLVVFSTQLLPKCDVCDKRIGVLPGWSSKHLECDGKDCFCVHV